MIPTHKIVNVWPYVQFDPTPFANFNHPDAQVTREFKEDAEIEELLNEYREQRGLRAFLDKIEKHLIELKRIMLEAKDER
jgi:cobalamin biosynthesis protein CobT